MPRSILATTPNGSRAKQLTLSEVTDGSIDQGVFFFGARWNRFL
jgi:hypothetical protein